MIRHTLLITLFVGAAGLALRAQSPQGTPRHPAIVNGRLVGNEIPADWPVEARSRNLTYTNPSNQNLAARWCDGEIVYRVSFGEVKVDPKTVRAAKEYLAVYKAPGPGEPWDAAERVPDQLPIYDTKPGDPGYSPIWHYHWVVVPRDYKPNTLRSEDDVKKGGYPIVPVEHYTN